MSVSEKSRGYIAMPRSVFTDSMFANEAMTEREAFLSLVADACWKSCRVRLQYGTVNLRRGQLHASNRFLAERWQWTESRVRRFLRRLSGRRTNDPQKDAESDAYIDAQPTRDGTIITIRNYDVFQKTPQPSNGGGGAHNGAQPDALRDVKSTQREEEIKTNNSVPLERAPVAPSTDIASDLFGNLRIYLESAAGLHTGQARKMIGKWRKDFSNDEAIIDAFNQAKLEEAQDPVAFITGCLKQKLTGAKSAGVMSAIAAMELYR
jgi:hypothetical protein